MYQKVLKAAKFVACFITYVVIGLISICLSALQYAIALTNSYINNIISSVCRILTDVVENVENHINPYKYN